MYVENRSRPLHNGNRDRPFYAYHIFANEQLFASRVAVIKLATLKQSSFAAVACVVSKTMCVSGNDLSIISLHFNYLTRRNMFKLRDGLEPVVLIQ